MSTEQIKNSLFELKCSNPAIDDSTEEEFFAMLSTIDDRNVLVSKLLFDYA
jgi:hypothetical protein